MGLSSGRTARLYKRVGACLLGTAAAAGMLVAGHHASVGAAEYSAYSDPDKTALSVILSEGENVREFQKEFGLDDAEVDKALAAVREENEALAKEYAESEKIVAAKKFLPAEKVADEISASDFDETVEDAVGETKDSVTTILPEGDEPELKAWVDEQWRQEVETTPQDSGARTLETKSGGTLVCKVFATQYVGYTRYEVALPHRKLKFGSQPSMPISRNGKLVRPRVKEVGPWNTYDNYWQYSKYRTMWKNLPRCRPEAQAAYYSNYNGGKDEYGRTVLNPAGVDLTPAVARNLGMRQYQNAWVYVRFPWMPA